MPEPSIDPSWVPWPDEPADSGEDFVTLPTKRRPPPAPGEPPATARIDEPVALGQYRIIRELGRGGMGTVYLAEDTRLRRPAALKVMLPTLAVEADARERFLREARA